MFPLRNRILAGILLAGLTLVFIVVIVSLRPFALFAGTELSETTLIALLVALIPTTIGALLSAAARTGKLEIVFVEVFHHEDAALEGLRNLDSGHGIDTTDGRDYDQVVLDGLADVARRLNNLVARKML